MKITVHRGTHQIGGCITEIECNSYKVFIDFGEQLPGLLHNELQPIKGLSCGDVSKSVLFITHYHTDHIGKISDTVAELPIYIGKTALEIYNCLESKLSHIPDNNKAVSHKKNIERIKTINTFLPLQQIKHGEITITPLLVDHSAFDAYMFIIEADNMRILHTGDFRGHGYRSKGLIPTLRKYAGNIDYIISEGTNIERTNAAILTEQELQKDFELQFTENEYNFILISSTNIDRIFGLYHAAIKAKRCFVCDKYQSTILKIVSESHSQHTPFYRMDQLFELSRSNGNPYSFTGNLKPYLEKHGFCMLIRPNNAFKLLMDEYAQSQKTKNYFSMWKGYLEQENTAFNQSLFNFLEPYQIEYMHTSGHADMKTLNAVYETVNPKRGIIPIHTEAPDTFRKLFPNHTFVLLRDGEVLG